MVWANPTAATPLSVPPVLGHVTARMPVEQALSRPCGASGRV